MNLHTAPLRSSLRLLTAVAALAIVAAVIPSKVTAVNATSSRSSQPKPTIVLVHGAWADSSSWARVVQQLQEDGYTVDVPPNPLRGVTSDPTYLADFLQTITGPIVLVGHSYGGMVITNAATGNAQVKELVFVDAFIPKQGETLPQLAGPQSALAGNPTTLFNFVPYPGGPAGDVDLYVKPSVFPGAFANGLPPKQAAELAATQRPLAFSTLSEPSGVPAWTTIPSWCLIGTADHVIPAAQQLFMCGRAKAHIVQVDAPHLSMIAKPHDVTDLIETAAHAAG
jgi:pimeloyl-ACP methyl ester carboxylesterase